MVKADSGNLIIGNWKMYKTVPEALEFVKLLTPQIKDISSSVYLAVPFTCIHALSKEAQGSPLVIGAQNMNDASEGAFTGEIAARMLREAGAQFVILGHSERRRLFHEDNAFINRKIKRAVQEGLRPVLCVGESMGERDAGNAKDVIKTQINECLADIDPKSLATLVVSYEPVWAIGTNHSASPEVAQEMQHFCRELLGEILSSKVAKNITLLYGGSVNSKNAAGYLDQPDINGLLLGGASLSLETFVEIINTSCKTTKEA